MTVLILAKRPLIDKPFDVRFANGSAELHLTTSTLQVLVENTCVELTDTPEQVAGPADRLNLQPPSGDIDQPILLVVVVPAAAGACRKIQARLQLHVDEILVQRRRHGAGRPMFVVGLPLHNPGNCSWVVAAGCDLVERTRRPCS